MAKDLLISMSTIDSLPIIKLGDDELVDLTKPTFDKSIFVKNGGVVIIDQSLGGKPHLVSKAVYGSQNFLDLLFSFNGYSNPLTVKGGDKLVVPPLQILQESMSTIGESSNTNGAVLELSKRLTRTTKDRIKFLMASENNFGDIKTPNMNTDGGNFTKNVDAGTISLGSSVATQSAVDGSISKIKNQI